MTAGFVFFGQVWRVIERPLCSTAIRGHSGCRTLGVNELVLNGPLDPFYLRVKVALIAGVIVSSPVWLYQIWAFAAPGLHAREKRWSYLFLGAAIPLFGAGIAAVLPVAGPVPALPARPDPGRRAEPDPGRPVPQLRDGDDARPSGWRSRLPLLLVMLNLAGDLDPRAVPEVAAGADLRGVPDRGHGQPEPGPAHHADPRRDLRGAGRGGRGHRVVPRPAPGPAAPRSLYRPSRRRAVPAAVRRPQERG